MFLVLQLAPSAAVLWFVVLGKGIALPRGSTLLWVLALGWLNPGVSYPLSMMGLVHACASVASLMWAAEPVFIIILAWQFLRERISLPMMGLTAVATFDVYLASGVGSDVLRAGLLVLSPWPAIHDGQSNGQFSQPDSGFRQTVWSG